jgi:hypothetical protein
MPSARHRWWCCVGFTVSIGEFGAVADPSNFPMPVVIYRLLGAQGIPTRTGLAMSAR